MSKVKIQGNASGTGVLTITAPNTSTDRTITLPDSTGTILDNTSTLDATKLSGDLPAISAASLTNVPKDTTVGGRKNMIINGAMRINQRGSVNTTDAGGEYALDRWETYLRGGAAATVSQATDVPSGQGFGNSLKIDVTTGDAFGTSNDLALLRTKWEGQDLQQLAYGTSSAKTLTLSFWIKSTITGTYMCSLNNNDDNDRMNNRSYTISSANTWEKKTLTFNGDTSAGTINNDNTGSIELRFWLASGSNYNTGTLSSDGNWEAYNVANQAVGHVNSLNSASNNIYLTGVQLELGSTATDFEHRSYGEELALCQRYYERFIADAGAEMLIGVGVNASATDVFINYPYKQIKRVIPSFSSSGASHFERLTASWGAGSSISCQANIATARLNMGGFPSSTTWNATEVRITAAANDAHWFAFDAEL